MGAGVRARETQRAGLKRLPNRLLYSTGTPRRMSFARSETPPLYKVFRFVLFDERDVPR
jgi:hypothetical protein